MNDLALVKSEYFGEVQCDFYQNEQKDIVMTSEQLGMALGYSEPRKSISNLINRNEYLMTKEFSGVIKMMTPSGTQETRIFNEDGIYEVTMLAKTEKAKEFRSWVRTILKKLRSGENIIIQPKNPDAKLLIQQQRAEAMLLNAKTRQAKLILDMQKNKTLSPVAVELLGINALEVITGERIDYKPELKEKGYTATDIAKIAGVSANKVGRVATQAGLKTEENGVWVLDKSRSSSKQVSSFLYNEEGKKKLIETLSN